MDLNDLEKIKLVEAPPYLFTRIQAKIENAKNTTISKKTAWAMSFAFIFILTLNVSILMSYQLNSNLNSTENYAQSIHLTTNNTLYK